MNQCLKCMAYLDNQGKHILYLGTYITPDCYRRHIFDFDAKTLAIITQQLKDAAETFKPESQYWSSILKY